MLIQSPKTLLTSKKINSNSEIIIRLVKDWYTLHGPNTSIALCNEGSYSNAEIFSHAYKTLGIGKVVGTPTNGSVISTGGRGLMDGSFCTITI